MANLQSITKPNKINPKSNNNQCIKAAKNNVKDIKNATKFQHKQS